jgi:hypothetical protein
MSEEEVVVRATQTLRDLTQKRDKQAARVEKIGEERKRIGYIVFADGDRPARKKLDELNMEAATAAGELEALEAAISEAKRRLEAARYDEAAAKDRAAATQVRDLAAKAADHACEADKHLSDAVAAVCDMFDAVRAMHRLGEAYPSELQVATNAVLAIKTSIMGLPLPVARSFEFLAPQRRRSGDRGTTAVSVPVAA